MIGDHLVGRLDGLLIEGIVAGFNTLGQERLRQVVVGGTLGQPSINLLIFGESCDSILQVVNGELVGLFTGIAGIIVLEVQIEFADDRNATEHLAEAEIGPAQEELCLRHLISLETLIFPFHQFSALNGEVCIAGQLIEGIPDREELSAERIQGRIVGEGGRTVGCFAVTVIAIGTVAAQDTGGTASAKVVEDAGAPTVKIEESRIAARYLGIHLGALLESIFGGEDGLGLLLQEFAFLFASRKEGDGSDGAQCDIENLFHINVYN